MHTTYYLQPGRQYHAALKSQQENQQAIQTKTDIENNITYALCHGNTLLCIGTWAIAIK